MVQLDDKLNVKPSLSNRYNVSSDGLDYEFFLRDDVFFHDHKLFDLGKGRKVVAKDFEYSFNRLIDKNLAAPGAWVMQNVESYKAQNDSVFTIRLKKPFSAFLSLLSMKYCSVVPHEIIDGGNFNNEPVGTGPFKFQLWKEDFVVIRRHPYNG